MGENCCEVGVKHIGYFPRIFNGVRLPGSANALADIGVETRSGIVCDLEFSFNIHVDQKRFRFVLRSDSTEPRDSSVVPQHALNCFAQVFLTSPLGGSREIISTFVLKIPFS